MLIHIRGEHFEQLMQHVTPLYIKLIKAVDTAGVKRAIDCNEQEAHALLALANQWCPDAVPSIELQVEIAKSSEGRPEGPLPATVCPCGAEIYYEGDFPANLRCGNCGRIFDHKTRKWLTMDGVNLPRGKARETTIRLLENMIASYDPLLALRAAERAHAGQAADVTSLCHR
jgi:hypothetical protein